MSNPNTIFQGNVQIYLQGKNALYPAPFHGENEGMLYHIGQENTEIIVQDYRKKPVAAAQEAIATQYQNGFSTIFNQRAWAQIYYELPAEKIEIELRDPNSEESLSLPLLWMGVLEDNTMPDYEVEWEVFKSLNSGQIAFVSLLPSPRSV